MTRDELRIEILVVLGIIAGRNYSDLPGAIRPITDLGLKSENGIDFAGELEIRLMIKIAEKVNPFVDDVKKCARCIDEIIELIEKCLTQKG